MRDNYLDWIQNYSEEWYRISVKMELESSTIRDVEKCGGILSEHLQVILIMFQLIEAIAQFYDKSDQHK